MAGYKVSRDTSDSSRSIFSPIKGNWAKQPAALAYKINEVKYVTKDSEEIITSRIDWDGEVDVKADDLGFQDPYLSPGEVADAIGFLKGDLENGSMAVKELYGTATKLGISKKALYKAARVMGINKRKEGFGDSGQWVWELPATISLGNLTRSDGSRIILEGIETETEIEEKPDSD
jgi:hypothetical protein